MFSLVCIFVVAILLVATLPHWSYSRNWGYFHTWGIGVVLVMTILTTLLVWRL